jgi:hypothetical protein
MFSSQHSVLGSGSRSIFFRNVGPATFLIPGWNFRNIPNSGIWSLQHFSFRIGVSEAFLIQGRRGPARFLTPRCTPHGISNQGCGPRTIFIARMSTQETFLIQGCGRFCNNPNSGMWCGPCNISNSRMWRGPCHIPNSGMWEVLQQSQFRDVAWALQHI